MIDFNEMDTFILYQEKPVTKEITGWFSNFRIDRDELPDGYFAYDLREGDLVEGPATLEPSVLVNHYGTVVFKEEITFPERGSKQYLELLYEDESNADTCDADYSYS